MENKTATQLNNTVTEGTNLCLGGKVYDCSGYTNDNENAQKLIDGDLNTKWCATSSNVLVVSTIKWRKALGKNCLVRKKSLIHTRFTIQEVRNVLEILLNGKSCIQRWK